MAHLNQEIKKTLELEAEAKSIQAVARIVATHASEKLKQLRERIKKGEMTEDKIRDFVIARYGLLSGEIEAVYRDLETGIRQHVGEFVLMITREENFHGCTGFGYESRDRDHVLDEHLYLGVLKDGALILDPANEKCELGTGNYARCWHAWHENVELIEANLTTDRFYDFGLHLNKPLERRNSFEEGYGLKLELKIGNVEVRAWFEKRGGKHYPVLFEKMAKLLRPAVDSLELTAESERRRQSVAKRLVGLVEERNELKREVERVPLESLVLSNKLKKIESVIERQLKIALELGMVDTELLSVHELCEEYGIKAS